eukprot:5844538-Pleurochrysis_carterae.AAC.1
MSHRRPRLSQTSPSFVVVLSRSNLLQRCLIALLGLARRVRVEHATCDVELAAKAAHEGSGYLRIGSCGLYRQMKRLA